MSSYRKRKKPTTKCGNKKKSNRNTRKVYFPNLFGFFNKTKKRKHRTGS